MADIELGHLRGRVRPSIWESMSPNRTRDERYPEIRPAAPRTREKVWNPHLVDGFARSAAFIVMDKDKASALFRRFDTSSMRNLLYLQARVASLTAKQKAFDEEDYAALNQWYEPPLKPKDPRDPKTRLEDLQRRLEIESVDTNNLERRIEDLALCLDYPLEPLSAFNGKFPWAVSSSKPSQVRDRPMGPLLDGDLDERLDNIVSLVAYRESIDIQDIENYLGVREIPREKSDPTWISWIGARTQALESLLEKSLKADFGRRIVPAQLEDFNMSWENMELFGNLAIYERRKDDWERKREEALNRGEEDEGEWPWDNNSGHWRRKMRERYLVAMDLKQALKEYLKYLFNRDIFQLPQPAKRTKRAQREWFTGAAIGFLVVAVWVLSVVSGYKTKDSVHSTEIELGVMTAFIVAFALWVLYFTTLSRKEVFGAVAAYAAVLVVFVGS